MLAASTLRGNAPPLRLRAGDETVLGEYFKHGRIVDGEHIEHAQHLAAQAWLADTLTGKRSLLIVDTNEQAERLSAQLRAELVRLRRVEEDGAAGRQAPSPASATSSKPDQRLGPRRLRGNRRGPINARPTACSPPATTAA
jgi:hypothetical protein